MDMDKHKQAKTILRILLGLFLIFAGIGHLSFSRTAFAAQVPPWVPLKPDLVVVLSGIVEILLGSSLLLIKKQRVTVGWVAAIFFILVFPGNIAQLVYHRNAFGLDSDLKRWLRLPLQPVLILIALWTTNAWPKKDHRHQELTGLAD
jgi:uncharacterized membrane protein